jgi:hypothetical protein
LARYGQNEPPVRLAFSRDFGPTGFQTIVSGSNAGLTFARRERGPATARPGPLAPLGSSLSLLSHTAPSRWTAFTTTMSLQARAWAVRAAVLAPARRRARRAAPPTSPSNQPVAARPALHGPWAPCGSRRASVTKYASCGSAWFPGRLLTGDPWWTTRGPRGSCKRCNSLNVRFALKATEVLRCRELTRCANRRQMHCSKDSRYSITSSARCWRNQGTSSPSALAVLRLMTSSNLVGPSTGRSAGFAPRSMRSTYAAARRNESFLSTP